MLFYLEKIIDNFNRPKIYLIAANFLLVFFLILLSNAGVLPIAKMQDFIFFAVIFLIFALYRPGWAFLLFAGVIALENINLAPESVGITIRPYQFIGGLALLAVIIRWIFKRVNFELPKFGLVDFSVSIFVLSGFISVLGSLNRGISFKQSIIALTFAALYFLTRIFVQNMNDLKKIIPFFLSSSIVVVFYGIWQNIRFSQGLKSFEAMPGRPNATFTEADWLGIYLVLLLAVLYAVIYFFSVIASEARQSQDIGQIQGLLRRFTPRNDIAAYLFLIPIYVLFILTVSRSAWLGAVAVTIIFLLAIFTNLKLNPKEWQWKKTLQIKLGILISLALSIAAVYFFHLTTFQLFNRVQSTGSGLQKITISCQSDIALPEKINSVDDLQQFNCRHINLENIGSEKAAGNFVKEINRPDPNVNVRAQIYQKSWETIKTHPVLGIGWGNSSSVLGKDDRGVDLNSSNIFLEAWLGSGILGFLVLVFIWCYILYQGGRSFLKNEGENKVLGLFVLLGSISILVPNLFNAGIFLGFLWVFWGISMANDNEGI